MKVKFFPGRVYYENAIDLTEVVNGIDLSIIPKNEIISPLPEILKKKGIKSVERNSVGELLITLFQAVISYEYPVTSHDWKQSPWIPDTEFDPNTCYIIPASVEGKTDYEMVFRDTVETLPNGVQVSRKGWTVVQIVPETNEEEL